MMKALRENGGVLLELASLTAEVKEARAEYLGSLQELLTEFKEVFEELCGLPPHQR